MIIKNKIRTLITFEKKQTNINTCQCLFHFLPILLLTTLLFFFQSFKLQIGSIVFHDSNSKKISFNDLLAERNLLSILHISLRKNNLKRININLKYENNK